MPTISLTLPVSGNVVTAGLHATNYTSIQSLVNGGLDTANWASGLIFAPSKFMQEAALRRDGIVWNGSIWAPTAVASVYDRATATVDVQNTLTETSLYTKQIAANDMGTNKKLRLTMAGDYLHNNVAADTVTFRVKFGGTTFWADANNCGNATGTGRHPWHWTVEVANLGASNSQYVSGVMVHNVANEAAPTTGIGVIPVVSGAGVGPFGITTLGTIDTTANQTLDVTAQWSAASANNSWRLRYAVLELV